MEAVERADPRAKFSGTEDVTATEDAVEHVAFWRVMRRKILESVKNGRGRGNWSRCHFDDRQRGSKIVKDYLKFLAEAEKEAVNPEKYQDMNDEDECARDQEVCATQEFSDAVAAGSSGYATCISVVRFGSQAALDGI